KLSFAKPRPLKPNPGQVTRWTPPSTEKHVFNRPDFVPGLTFWIYGGSFLYGASQL
ncbi:uncharacterized protein EI90DRAFT_3058715, partial [Cantharellus anzutake]|uniref:uncharacterized protein n=1 Tax=Cantharellus anzutake TaxID=1750568 RepID=UPI0019084D3B